MTISNPNVLAPLIKDFQAWNAFEALLDHHQAKAIKQLETIQCPDTLVRINAEFRLLEELRKARTRWLDIEKGLMQQ